jgi:predicted lipoprotein with Yx(FWY)xxD motif
MRRTLPVLAALASGVIAGVASAAPQASITVKVAKNAAIGSILVSGAGKTLYHRAGETKASFKCVAACAKTWVPLTIAPGAKPTGGPGIAAAKLGTAKRPDGRLQVTYNGLTLYRYADDAKAGDARGQGEDKLWYAVIPAGKITKASAAPAPAPKACPILGGRVGGALSTGGTGNFDVGCNFVASGMQIQVAGHTFASVATSRAEDSCSAAGDTITCTFDVAGQAEGIAVAGAWASSLSWRFAATDSNSKTGDCGFPGTVTLTNAGATVYSKPIILACSA